MDKINKKDQLKYYKFLNSLPKKINKLYFKKLAGKFKLHNKSKKSNGFDPVTNIDQSIEIFLRKEIAKKFPKDGIVGEEFKVKKSKINNTYIPEYFSYYKRALDDLSYPVTKPPWGTLTASNLNNGKIIWQVPFGEYEFLKEKGIPQTGTENFGGVTATSGNIAIATGTLDKKMYVF